MTSASIETGTAWFSLARAAASTREIDEVQHAARPLLTFVLAGAAYAIPVERVQEIVRMRKITSVPRLPNEVRGVISLRGVILQVVDLRRRLGLADVEPERSSRIIVVHREDCVAGLLVDAVTEVLRVGDDDLLPSTAGEVKAVECLCRRGEEFVSCLDLDRVLEIDGEC